MALTKCLNRSIGDASTNIVKRVCQLKPMESEMHIIHLVSGKNIIGRNRATGVRDVRCSKRQIELEVNLDEAQIKLTVLGINPCSVNGLMIMQNSACDIKHGDILELVYGRHAFEVIFKPAPEKLKDNASTPDVIEDQSREVSWDSVENGKMVVFTSIGVRPSEKIAGYDLDGTIITTKSGNVFPKNIDDWQIIYPEVAGKLKRLYEDGYKICFFTNQAGIAKGKIKLDEFKQKICLILKKLNVPVQVFIAIGSGYYRKPLPGMWEYLQDHKNSNIKLQLARCFYVGDAAGRPELSSGVFKRRKDHSLADRLFASNIGVSFYTPEEHFLNKKVETWSKPDFEPRSIHENIPLLEPDLVKIPSHKCEMIIMVGLPGSGKSHFCKEYLEPLDYTLANADTLGSIEACLKKCESASKSGKSCVVDNTNLDIDARKKFIHLANRLQIPCRCFVMSVTVAHAKHNIAFRELTDASHSKINDMIFNTMKKKYKEPTLSEGFTEITRVNLKPKFDNDKHEHLYKLYLVEK